MVKALKAFMFYVLHSIITTFVPSSSVKEILVQPDSEGKRGKWIVKLLEYDLHINPTNLIKGKGLAKLLSESNCKVLELHQIFTRSDARIIHSGQDSLQVSENYSSSPWYKNIIYFLQHFECPPNVRKTKARSLKLKDIKFFISNQSLYWRDPVGILLKCLDENEAKQITFEMHRGVCGGHQHLKATNLKIPREGYYWLVLLFDVFSIVRACNECQMFVGKHKLLSLPLKPINANSMFQQWGLDFIGEINPPSSGKHKWIITTSPNGLRLCPPGMPLTK
jgi:hypothetical protein